jgi:hypothetical protein
VARAAKDPETVGAAAVDYLYYSGYVVFAWFHARAVAALRDRHAEDFRAAKLATARFYFARILPRTLAHAATLRAGTDSLMALDETNFAIA